MENYILFSILVIINIATAWAFKRIFGLSIFERWPKYDNKIKNILTSLAPVIFWAFSCGATYLIYINIK